MPWLPLLVSAASLLLIAIVLWLLLRPRESGLHEHVAQAVTRASERLERELRDEVARSAQGTRLELGGALGSFQQTLLAQQGEVARGQNEQIDSFRTQLADMHAVTTETLRTTAAGLTQSALASREAQDAALQRFGASMTEQLRALTESNERRLGEVRTTVEQRLTALAADNEKKLEQMRLTVDEKLHATLEHRLGESFKQVAERLEAVHAGLGEMRKLAGDVGSLNRMLTNVKTRGVFGEVQLAGLIEQVFTIEQFGMNVETVPGSGARVEFAIKFPGRGAGHDAAPLWLPIDAKFPREDYERLLDAQERADAPAAEAAGRAIEQRLRIEARTIREKYIAAPYTTEFGILFVPTEGLYAEALRRPGLVEALQRDHRVTLCGPTTLLATLTSLQMGFRTLALEQRSTQVWEVLGAVKAEFGKFGDVLAKTQKKLREASDTIDAAQTRTRQMQRKLKSVETLDDAQVEALLPGGAAQPELLEASEDDEPADSPSLLPRIGNA